MCRCLDRLNLSLSVCGKTLNIMWYNWSLLLIPLVVPFIAIFEEIRNMIYMPVALAICSFILFVNFPNLVLTFHQRPLYYDDLVIKDFNDDDAEKIFDDGFRRHYQNIFRWVVTLTSPVVIAVLTEVWYIKSEFATGDTTESHNTTTSFLDPSKAVALAVILSLGQGYLKASVYFGKALMIILKFFKSRALQRNRQQIQRMAFAEMNELGVEVATDPDLTSQLLDSDATRIAMTQPAEPVSMSSTRVRAHSDPSSIRQHVTLVPSSMMSVLGDLR